MRCASIPFVPCLAASFLAAPTPGAAEDVNRATLTCVSEQGARQHCPAYTDAGVLLERSTGEASCLLGRSWGYDAEGIWVTEGCGGQFALGNGAHEQQRLTTLEATRATAVAATNPALTDSGFSLYSKLGAQTAIIDGEAQVQDAGSRVRFGYSSEDERFLAVAEWAVNLTTSASTLNAGETTASGFLTLDDESSDDVLGARLGYVGIDLGEQGTITLGKQWSVYYDVTSFTDAFNAFGAEATATFNAQTDGGFTGTGRADGALLYRRSFLDKLDVGLQVQMRGFENEEFFDGYGFSARARVTPRVELGVSYIRSLIDATIKASIPGFDDDAEYRSAGVRYRGDKLTLSAVYAEQKNGDLAKFPSVLDGAPIVVGEVFDAEGGELFARYQLGSWGLVAGYPQYSPRLDAYNVLTAPSAEVQRTIMGFDYRAARGSLLFAEYRESSGVDVLGVPADDVLVVGAKHEFGDVPALR
jgi:predicted porin